MGNTTIAVVAAALCIALAAGWTVLLRTSPIDPASIDLPPSPQRIGVFAHNKRLQNAHKLGSGLISNTEDLALDSQGRLYTGSGDGWIKRISFLDNLDVLVENWTYVGGRPLGLAFGIHGELLVCEPSQGLLNVTEGHVEILTDEADGLKFKIADGVDASREGAVYFTDASYKYGFDEHLLDIIEYRPHGRLLKYEASTKTTSVLLEDLYFPNGVALSAKQDFLVFCETSVHRCQKYWLEGPDKGTVEDFFDNLPGLPDSIRYDGNDTFWIALSTIILLYIQNYIKLNNQCLPYRRFKTGSLFLNIGVSGFFTEPNLILDDCNKIPFCEARVGSDREICAIRGHSCLRGKGSMKVTLWEGQFPF